MKEDMLCDDSEEVSASSLVDGGNGMLNQHRLSEAEELFHKVLELPHYAVQERYHQLVIALLGLAEVYTKRGRSLRYNELEWHRMHMHAVSSKLKAIDICNEALEFAHDYQDVKWFREQRQKSQNSLKITVDSLVKHIQERTLHQKKEHKTEKIDENEEKKDGKKEDKMVLKDPVTYVDLTWLQHFQTYYKEKCATSRFLKWQSQEQLVIEDNEEEIIEEPVVKEEKRKINFDKVQSAIQKIVKHISEMGNMKIHPDMTPDEKLTLFSPISDEHNVFKQFAKILYKEDSSGSSGDGDVTPQEGTSELEEALSSGKQSRNSVSRSVSRETSPPKGEEVPISWTEKGEKPMPFTASALSLKRWESIEDIHKSYLESAKSRPVREGDILRHGVLRIWKSYSCDKSPDKNLTLPSNPYPLQTYEEMSPLTEMIGKSKRSQTTEDINDYDGLPERTPLSEVNLDISLAHVLCHMANGLKKKKKMSEAAEMYKTALGIMQENMSSKNDRALMTTIGTIMQNLGDIRCAEEDLVGGSQLMEEAIALYEKSGERLKIVRVWYELGNAYMADHWKEMSFLEHVMKMVQEALQRDFRREVVDDDDIPDDVSEDSDDSDGEGESYSICTEEAITCYYNALEILRKYPSAEEDYDMLLVEVLTKLGDSTILVGNFDKATLHYEEALVMFKNIIGSATLHNNAHVLSMLATSNFMLGHYPKAVSMYECANLLQQHLYSGELANFDVAFTLTMLSICFYCMKHYHKCISWCLKAFDLYSFLYKEDIVNIKVLQRWFVTQTLYTLGYSYGTLSFNEKSLHYLKLSRNMLLGVEDIDFKQCVRILKAIADLLVTTDENEKALEYYNEALDMTVALGDEKSTTALQNQLLNRIASVHVSSKQYETAAEYLRQALDCQKNVENNIKDDMVNIQQQLGLTYTMSGDMDKAIECYSECLESYSEMSGSHAGNMAQVYGKLGTLHHVKACLQEDNDHMIDLLLIAEKNYQDAIELDASSTVCVKYANYLYQQSQAADALIAMLPFVHLQTKHDNTNISYNGVEQAVLPEHLQQEIDDTDDVELDVTFFARFLAVLCYKQLNMVKDAEDCLIDLLHDVATSQVPLNHSILGYAMLEMNMHKDAAESFSHAASLTHDNDLAITNYWLALGTLAFSTWMKGAWNIYEHYNKDDLIQQWLTEMPLLPILDITMEEEGMEASGIRDSGYYDHGIIEEKEEIDWDAPKEDITYEEEQNDTVGAHELWVESETVETPAAILQAMITEQNREEIALLVQHEEQQEAFMDRGYYSSEYLERQGLDEHDLRERRSAKWESEESMDTLTGVPEEAEYDYIFNNQSEEFEIEETVETPAAILELLQQQQEDALMRERVMYGALLNNFDISPEEKTDDVTIDEERSETPTLFASGKSYGTWRSSVPDVNTSKYEFNSRSISSPDIQSHTAATRHSFVEEVQPEEDSPTEVWITEEVEVETPVAILKLLSSTTNVSRDSSESPSISQIQTDTSSSWDQYQSEQYNYKSLSSSQETSRSRETTPLSTASSSSYHSTSPYVRLREEPLEELHISEEEPEEENLDVLIIDEEEIETPVAVLKAIQREHEEREKKQNANEITPMEMSPERETLPESSAFRSWTSHSSSMYQPTRTDTEEINYSSSNHHVHRVDDTQEEEEEEEVVWVTEEVISTPTAILEAIKNNNNGLSSSVPTTQSFISTATTSVSGGETYSGYEDERETSPVIYETWTSESILYPTVHCRLTPTDQKNETAIQKDIQNGNHKSLTSIMYHEFNNKEEEPEEEKWETWEEEEIVETPPEILQAILRAQQMQ